MSYIIKSDNPFASTKLTETGREKLAKGQLTFTSWAIGDSEINYDREYLIDEAIISGDTKVLRPKDRQPNLKYFITTGGSALNTFNSGDVRCIKVIINNEADERGFFTDGGVDTKTDLTGYTRTYGTLSGGTINGGTTVQFPGGSNIEEGDFILFKVNYNADFTNIAPEPHLWYKVKGVVTNLATVDRELPTLSTDTTYLIYKGGEPHENEPDSISYWDSGTLAFDSSCEISASDTPIWAMNAVHSENVLGLTGATTEKFEDFGSYDYVGEKNNYLYDTDNETAIGIIHYTNKTISNFYGEFFHIDNDTNTVKINMPDLMYHRRYFAGGSTSGDTMGMAFVASGDTLTVGSNGLNYVQLIEDPTLIPPGDEALVVGRVYPDLKIITIDDDELLATMMYKSNRNWTLPELVLGTVNPAGGSSAGVLAVGETIYVTYSVDNVAVDGITPTLPCQKYATYTNDGSTTRDITFNLIEPNFLPYMQNDRTSGGFYGDSFKVIYQITDGSSPTTEAWKVSDFTGSVSGGTGMIDVGTLETQNPIIPTPSFEITQTSDGLATTYSIDNILSMPTTDDIDVDKLLQFGDERFFYGNIEASIGATIFKTLFKLTINASDFNVTTNLTRSTDPATNPPAIKVSEVGIYDSDGDLVIVSKLSKPISLESGNTVMIELSMDF